jgi:hypothetical protein
MVIERKLPTDINYVEISTIQFSGNFAAGTVNYTDELAGVSGGIDISYRLKMNIASDTSFYLDSATVNYRQACTSIIEKITISPNPVTERLSILIARNSIARATIIIHNGAGQKIYSKTQVVSGSQIVYIPMKQISRGIYFVSIYLNGKKVSIKKIIRD